MIAATFSVVISSDTLYTISLGFLNLCFMISSRSRNLMFISELSEFISSSLPVSIKIPLSLNVLTALIPTLMSVGLMFFFSWSVICSGERVSFPFSVILYRLFSAFFYRLRSFLPPPSDGRTCLTPFLGDCCTWSIDVATCLNV